MNEASNYPRCKYMKNRFVVLIAIGMLITGMGIGILSTQHAPLNYEITYYNTTEPDRYNYTYWWTTGYYPGEIHENCFLTIIKIRCDVDCGIKVVISENVGDQNEDNCNYTLLAVLQSEDIGSGWYSMDRDNVQAFYDPKFEIDWEYDSHEPYPDYSYDSDYSYVESIEIEIWIFGYFNGLQEGFNYLPYSLTTLIINVYPTEYIWSTTYGD